ncbi:MAG: MBL fold metallo-hydrolase [Rikenellaceae bacterium]
MNIATLTFNPLGENTYVVWDETKECIIIDAGMYSSTENSALERFVADKGLTPVMAVNTHGHFDHLLGVEWLRGRYNIPFALSSRDQYLLDNCKEGSVIYGMPIGAMPSSMEVDLSQMEELTFGNTTLQIIETPGHTPGHVLLYNAENKVAFTGDTLFCESIGRTDLPGGDYAMIMTSILERIMPLGDEVKIYPGHGGDSTIGHEALYNPYIVEVLNHEVNFK